MAHSTLVPGGPKLKWFRPHVTGGVSKQATTSPFESALYNKTAKQVSLPTSVLVLGWSTLGNS